MHLTQPVPAGLLHSAPVGLLHLDLAGRVAIVNPRALDLLGRSVFDCLDRPVVDVLGIRPGTEATALPGREGLVATGSVLAPPYVGELVAIERTGTADLDDGARQADLEHVARVEAALDRAASTMPLAAPALARRELARAIAELHGYARRHDDAALARVCAHGDSPPVGKVELTALLQEALVERAARIRLVGTQVAVSKTGPVEAQTHGGLARVAISDLLDWAIDAAGADGSVSIVVGGDLVWRHLRIETTAAVTVKAVARRAADPSNAPLPPVLARARRVAELLGGRLDIDTNNPLTAAALALPAPTAPSHG